jgi:hypothetical protein
MEHPLPAAFGEFVNAPALKDRICTRCNNTILGVLDEQLVRSGPEGFLRRHYGVHGRPGHDVVNPFYRGSAGGRRVDLKAFDEKVGTEVLLECKDGVYRQVRQIIFVEKSGRSHHIPIREGMTGEQLLRVYGELGVTGVFEVCLLCDLADKEWVEGLVASAWPSVNFGWTEMQGSVTYTGVAGAFVLTNRYFRAVAKMGFHYFLTRFRGYTGHEHIFSAVREFILDEDSPVDRANAFISRRQLPLLREMLPLNTRPEGWYGHILSAETKNGECIAQVQMFLSQDWPAPIYTIRLGCAPSSLDDATCHLYAYYQDGPRGRYAGEAHILGAASMQVVMPPPLPAVEMP